MTSSVAKKKAEELTSGYGLPPEMLALLAEEVAWALDLAEAGGRVSERDAALRWLRGEPRNAYEADATRQSWFMLERRSDEIERGEHRREEES